MVDYAILDIFVEPCSLFVVFVVDQQRLRCLSDNNNHLTHSPLRTPYGVLYGVITHPCRNVSICYKLSSISVVESDQASV